MPKTFNGSVALFMKDPKEFNKKIESKVERIESKVDKNSESIEKLFNITSNMAEFVGYKIK